MKYDQIAEAYINILIEGRIDDLKTQNPHLVNEIDSYVQSDPTPQKKFVPWLVSQHKKGNVTPDDPDLSQTLSGFETYKSQHGIRDHSSKSYQEIKDVISPFLGTAATNKDLKKQQIHEGIDQIYSSPDNKIQAFHVKTKEASQHVYGGGKKLGGLHTDWCVGARGNKCMFGNYGSMYTIHAKDDPKSPYAVHLDGPSYDRITTRNNVPDEYELNEGLEKFPHLKDAVDKIKDVHDEIKKIKKIKKDIKNAVKNPNPDIALAALNHRYVTNDIVNIAAENPNPDVAKAALNHSKSTTFTTWMAARHPNPEVAIAALRHPEADAETIWRVAAHPNPEVAMSALRHPKSDMVATWRAVEHSNPEVAIAGLNHSKADWGTTHRAVEHPNPEVAIAALMHKYANASTINNALNHSDQRVRELAKRLQGT